MGEDSSFKQKLLRNKHYILLIVFLALGIYLQITYLFAEDVVLASVLFVYATISTFGAFWLWNRFIAKYSQKIFSFVCESFLGKKLIGGSSLIYYEQKKIEAPVGFFTPIGRLISLLIAFLGISTTIIKTLRSLTFITFDTPTESWISVITWILLLTVVPIILTPIIPVAWAMDDLGLKGWNAKRDINWMIADRYKSRFNGLIAIGAVTAGFTLTEGRAPSLLDNALLFVSILFQGTILLIYPLTVLTAIYFALFQGKITEEVKSKLSLPVARTELIYDYEAYALFESLMAGEDLSEEEILNEIERLRKISKEDTEVVEEEQPPVKPQEVTKEEEEIKPSEPTKVEKRVEEEEPETQVLEGDKEEKQRASDKQEVVPEEVEDKTLNDVGALSEGIESVEPAPTETKNEESMNETAEEKNEESMNETAEEKNEESMNETAEIKEEQEGDTREVHDSDQSSSEK